MSVSEIACGGEVSRCREGNWLIQLVRLHALTRCDSICKRPRILCREATTMAVTIYPVTPSFAAEVGDVDLSRQIEPSIWQQSIEAFAEVRGLDLSRSASLAGPASRLRQALRTA